MLCVIGCGYVGYKAAKFFQSKGDDLTVTCTSTDKLKLLKAQFPLAILLSGNHLLDWLQIPFQTESLLLTMAPKNREDYEATYLHTTQNLLKARSFLPHLKRVLFVSSTSVYSQNQGEWVDELTPPTPSTPYSKILIESESTLQNLPQTIQVTIFRCGEIYGHERSFEHRLKKNAGTPLPGTGDTLTNLIHVDDLIRAIDFAWNKEIVGIFNLCNEVHIPRRDLYKAICEIHQLPQPHWDPSLKNFHGGNRKITSKKIFDLGFTLQHTTVETNLC